MGYRLMVILLIFFHTHISIAQNSNTNENKFASFVGQVVSSRKTINELKTKLDWNTLFSDSAKIYEIEQRKYVSVDVFFKTVYDLAHSEGIYYNVKYSIDMESYVMKTEFSNGTSSTKNEKIELKITDNKIDTINWGGSLLEEKIIDLSKKNKYLKDSIDNENKRREKEKKIKEYADMIRGFVVHAEYDSLIKHNIDSIKIAKCDNGNITTIVVSFDNFRNNDNRYDIENISFYNSDIDTTNAYFFNYKQEDIKKIKKTTDEKKIYRIELIEFPIIDLSLYEDILRKYILIAQKDINSKMEKKRKLLYKKFYSGRSLYIVQLSNESVYYYDEVNNLTVAGKVNFIYLEILLKIDNCWYKVDKIGNISIFSEKGILPDGYEYDYYILGFKVEKIN